jgi:murein DD-endopeptidase MepM/ murein hydrolase activator NlpD
MTRIPTETENLNPIPTLTKTVQPTPTETKSVDCGNIFCSVPWDGMLERPISDDFRNVIDPSYPYASTRNRTLDPHHGVEWVNSTGTPVLAAQTGEVVYAGSDDLTLLGPYTGFYGNVIVLQHPGLYQGRDVFTLYAHLSVIMVDEDDQVDRGEIIGKVGASGSADGSHLHFEVRLDVNDYAHTTNPMVWFSPVMMPEGGQASLLAGVIIDKRGNPVSQFQLSLEKLDEAGGVQAYYYPFTYYPAGVNSHPVLQENFSVSDLSPGDYRLAFIFGRLYEVYFTLEPGQLGFIKIVLD